MPSLLSCGLFYLGFDQGDGQFWHLRWRLLSLLSNLRISPTFHLGNLLLKGFQFFLCEQAFLGYLVLLLLLLLLGFFFLFLLWFLIIFLFFRWFTSFLGLILLLFAFLFSNCLWSRLFCFFRFYRYDQFPWNKLVISTEWKENLCSTHLDFSRKCLLEFRLCSSNSSASGLSLCSLNRAKIGADNSFRTCEGKFI